MDAPTDRDKIKMALDRLALFEREHKRTCYTTSAEIAEFIANMRLRLEHGAPGDTVACFAIDGT